MRALGGACRDCGRGPARYVETLSSRMEPESPEAVYFLALDDKPEGVGTLFTAPDDHESLIMASECLQVYAELSGIKERVLGMVHRQDADGAKMERIVWYRHPLPPECPDNQEHDFPGPNDGAEVEPHDVAHVVRSACRNCGLRRTIDFWDSKTKRYAPAGLCSYEVSTKDPGQYGEMLREMNRRLKDKA